MKAFSAKFLVSPNRKIKGGKRNEENICGIPQLLKGGIKIVELNKNFLEFIFFNKKTPQFKRVFFIRPFSTLWNFPCFFSHSVFEVRLHFFCLTVKCLVKGLKVVMN